MIFVFILLFTLLLIYIIRSCIRPKSYPPGPLFLPFFGSAHRIAPCGTEFQVEKWVKQYGSIIGHKFGYVYLVYLTTFDDIMEGFKHPNFQGRIKSEVFRQRSFHEEMGFFFASDERWLEVRRFSLRYFSQIFNTKLEDFIETEMSEFFSTLKSDEIIMIDGSFMKIPLNIIMQFLCGCTRAEYKQEIDKIQELTEKYFLTARLNGIELVYPFLKKFFDNDVALRAINYTQNFLKNRLIEHKNTFNELSINDFMDAFLLEQQKEKNLHGVVKYYTDEELLSCIFDFIQAGNESTGKTIEFLLLYVALNSRVQDKIHAELDSVVGRNRSPKLADKPNLPYLDAVTSETLRINPISPNGVMHRVTADTEFRGFHFPKDTLLYFAHKYWLNNPDVWNEPDTFFPERFIADSSLKRKITVFGQGKRSCIGEILARNSIYLFASRFFQNYSIQLPPGQEKPSTMPQIGITNGPLPFEIIITKRS